jgi:NADP-dependent 3-hydroxy acid dehydrogenase YdfG
MDVNADGSVSDGVGRIVRGLEPVDVLVNDAGIDLPGQLTTWK